MQSLNELYAQMIEICETGKVLYGKTQKEKLPDYTFTYLMKKVRVSTKKAGTANKEVATA